jgi:DNA-binding response OmpR family regulator
MAGLDRVLVVEDDHDARDMFATALAQAGYAVDVAEDGFQALRLVADRHPDLVLTDLQMPGMNGLELIRRIRSIDLGVPVVLTTGLETQNLCTAAGAFGAEACLEKPVSIDELLWIIDRSLAVVRSTGERAAVAPG